MRTMVSVALFGLIGVVLLGCGSTKVMRTSEMEGLNIGSPLRGIASKIVHVQTFSDQRGVDPKYIGKDGFIIETDRPVSEVVALAIAAELKRNSHVVSSDRSVLTINGTVLEYGIGISPGALKMTSQAKVKFKADVLESAANRIVLSKVYEGLSYLEGGMITFNRRYVVLNEALLQAVREFTTDPSFVSVMSSH